MKCVTFIANYKFQTICFPLIPTFSCTVSSSLNPLNSTVQFYKPQNPESCFVNNMKRSKARNKKIKGKQKFNLFS